MALRIALLSGIMNDAETSFAEIKAKILAFAKERDWEQFHSPKNLTMAIATEASELMEHFLWETTDSSSEIVERPELRAKVEEELSDVIIYALEFANIAKIDVAAAIESKMAQNAQKYPIDKAFGRSTKYTDL